MINLMDADPIQPLVQEEDDPLISIHAMTGETTFQTLKVVGQVGKQQLLILIDSGSSHNFLDRGLDNAG